MLNWILLREFVFCRRMELNKWICGKKKTNELYFYKGHDEVKESQPNQIQVQFRLEFQTAHQLVFLA